MAWIFDKINILRDMSLQVLIILLAYMEGEQV